MPNFLIQLLSISEEIQIPMFRYIKNDISKFGENIAFTITCSYYIFICLVMTMMMKKGNGESQAFSKCFY